MVRQYNVLGRLFFVWPLAALVLALGQPVLAAEGPLELAGLHLGRTVEEQKEKLQSADAGRTFHRPYLAIVSTASQPGFRSGYVDYGLCAKPGRVVRIKMNYADESLAFFNHVMKALKKRYGEPKEWRGNAFGTLRTWKWSLTAANGQAISLILMHYEGDDGAFTEGNSIRISATDMVREEEQCYAAKEQAATGRTAAKAEAARSSLPPDWFLPR